MSNKIIHSGYTHSTSYNMTGKCGEKQLLLHDYETSSEHNLSRMTQWGKHKTVILLALKHSIIEKTWSIICSSLLSGHNLNL